MVDIKKYTELLNDMTEIMSVSGFEKSAYDELRELIGGYFDSSEQDSVGNMLFYKHAPDKNAPTVMLDAHFDTVGFSVSGIVDDGQISVAPIGGIDTNILPFSHVTVHGREKLCGIMTCDMSGIGNIPIEKFCIDTGYSKEEIKKLVSVGDSVTYRSNITHLMNERIVGASFDDKACAAALVCTIMSTPNEKLAFNICLSLSSREEVGGGGAAVVGKNIKPAAAIVTDVNFAAAPGVPEDESSPLGHGAMTSLSAVTDRALTNEIIQTAQENDIPLSPVVEALSTGTNATLLYNAGEGIPCAVLSLPLAGMHTAAECISTADVTSFCEITESILTNAALAARLKS